MQKQIQYTIHDVSALLGISADAIRLYEKEGLVEPLRNPANGYRYYTFDQIHRIMGIALYRQLGVGLAEIGELLKHQTFSGISDKFSDFIEASEEEIRRQQVRIEKLRFMQQHLNKLNEGINTYSVQRLPDCCIMYHQEYTELWYHDMKQIFRAPYFSFGNFCYTLQEKDKDEYESSTLEFVIRKPMYEIMPEALKEQEVPVREGGECLYTVKRAPAKEHVSWYLHELQSYAEKNHYICASRGYAFYIYSLLNATLIEDYYEIYLPILDKK